jgi:hypothetical protein
VRVGVGAGALEVGVGLLVHYNLNNAYTYTMSCLRFVMVFPNSIFGLIPIGPLLISVVF